MNNPQENELTSYIVKTLKAGFSQDQIAEALWKKGWTKQEIEEAFEIASETSFGKFRYRRWLFVVFIFFAILCIAMILFLSI